MKRLFCLCLILIVALALPVCVSEGLQIDEQGYPVVTDDPVDDVLLASDASLDGGSLSEGLDVSLDLDAALSEEGVDENGLEANALPKSLKLGLKETYKLQASNARKFSTSNKKVATVTKKGVIKGVKVGSATITVTSWAGKKTKIRVTVLKAPKSVKIKAAKKSLKVGKTAKLKAVLPNKTASHKITWSSSNKAIATVDSNGVVKGVSTGTVTITAKTFNKKKGTCKIKIRGAHSSVGPNDIPWYNLAPVKDWRAFSSFSGTERAPYICSEPDFSGKLAYEEFAVDFRADHLPIGTYLCVNTWDFDDHGLLQQYSSVRRDYSGVAGYAGFQRHYDGNTFFILSVWDSYCYDAYGNMTRIQARQVYPENNKGFEAVVGDTVTGEGCFVHTLLPFDWREGKNYRALLQLTNPYDGGNSHLLFYVCDLQTKAWYLLVEYDLGYNGNSMNRCVSFLEDFSANAHADIRSMALSNYRVHPRGQADWVSTRDATLSCSYSNNGSYRYGSQGNAFWVITTAVPGVWPEPANYKQYTVTRSLSGSPY